MPVCTFEASSIALSAVAVATTGGKPENHSWNLDFDHLIFYALHFFGGDLSMDLSMAIS